MNHDVSSALNGNTSGMIEILLFSLGGTEVFGMNVFKIREVTEWNSATHIPGQPESMSGVISLRGQVLPVMNLGEAIGMGDGQEVSKLIISEFASRSVAFAVNNVDKIVRVPWSSVKPPQRYDSESGSVFGVVMLEDNRLVSLLDVESICQRVLPESETTPLTGFDFSHAGPVFFVDDSLVARKKIAEVLDKMGLRHSFAVNGVDAQDKLLAMVNGLEGLPNAVRERVSLVLVDEEMPEMDGCTLTQSLRNDPRFKDVPIIMYSSLTSDENAKRGIQAGVNTYVKKFDSESLSKAIGKLLEHA